MSPIRNCKVRYNRKTPHNYLDFVIWWMYILIWIQTGLKIYRLCPKCRVEKHLQKTCLFSGDFAFLTQYDFQSNWFDYIAVKSNDTAMKPHPKHLDGIPVIKSSSLSLGFSWFFWSNKTGQYFHQDADWNDHKVFANLFHLSGTNYHVLLTDTDASSGCSIVTVQTNTETDSVWISY